MFYISVSIIIIATVLFYCEVNQNRHFDSIVVTSWWVFMTINFVLCMYGDMVPKTEFGRIVGAITAIWGITLLSLPIAVIGANFSKIYREEEKSRKWLKKSMWSFKTDFEYFFFKFLIDSSPFNVVYIWFLEVLYVKIKLVK